MDKINIAKIKPGSMVDGPGGPRTVVWLQGCSIRCQGCQNWALWPKRTSDMLSVSPEEAARIVLAISDGQPITITGGEPFDQAEVMGPFTKFLRNQAGELGMDEPHIIIYTGYRYEDLVQRASMKSALNAAAVGAFIALDNANVLVDGQYDETQDSPWIQWRGSRNQRPIDLRATRNWCQAVNQGGWLDEQLMPITLEEDWDTPTLEVVGGVIYGTGGLLGELYGASDEIVKATERCGEFMERTEK